MVATVPSSRHSIGGQHASGRVTGATTRIVCLAQHGRSAA